MKRHYEDESLDLIGRSAAERSLDRFYNRQRSKLKDKKDGLKILNQNIIPFPEKKVEYKIKEEKFDKEKKNLKEILSDILIKHLPSKSKFIKSLRLFTKLSRAYFEGSYKTEVEDISFMDFFRGFCKVNELYIKEYAGIIPKDLLELKEVLIDFIDMLEIVKDIKDFNYTEDEILFLRYLNTSIKYSVQLWYETDPFIFHKIVSELSQLFNILEADVNELNDINNNSNQINELNDVSQSLTTNVSWEVPSKNDLITLELRAYTRCLSVVFTFYQFQWAKSSIEPLFQRIYLKRLVFDESDQVRISQWQSYINANRSRSSKIISVQKIGEANFQVKDGKEEKIVSTHGSQIWCQKQQI